MATLARSTAERMVTRRRLRSQALAVLCVLASVALAWLLTRPPSPLAAAERLFQAAVFHLLAPLQPPHPRIVLIAIGDETLDAFPYRSPVDRAFLARLVEELAQAGVAAIGIDLLFDQPTEPAKDAALYAALRRQAVPVVALSAAPETGLPPQRAAFLQAFTEGLPVGTGNLTREVFDDTVRDHQPRHPLTGAPSFPAALAQSVGVAPPEAPFPIAWRRTAQGSVAAAYPAEAAGLLPADWLRGRIALIGSMQRGVDEHRTMASAFGPRGYGVEIHAQVLAQILDGRAWPDRSLRRELLATAALAVAGVLAGLGLSGRRAALVVGGLGLGWLGLVSAGIADGAVPWPGLPPVLGLVLASGATRAWRARGERRDRLAVQRVFARFVSAPVAQALMAQRELFLAGGRPRPQELTATVMFADIAGFTSICETLPPEPLVAWLDRYIDTMVEIITAHGGVVLRFIGDGILAAFGVPVPRQDPAAFAADAQAAARCALAMEDAMARLNAAWRAEGLPEAGLRIGIHTGPMVAGSLGRGERLEYCLLGDTANVGARLEQLGKQHGGAAPGSCTILVGEPTWRLLDGIVPGQRIGELALRNRSAPMAAWRIDRGCAATPPDPRCARAASDPG